MKIFNNKFVHSSKYFLLPFFAAIFPAVFHYGNNATILILPSLFRIIVFNSLITIIIYGFVLALKKQAAEAANAVFIFLIFYNTYGILYEYLFNLDVVRIQHFTLLPLFILTSIYASWLVSKLNRERSIYLWNSLVFIVGILVLFNIGKIVSVEIKKLISPPAKTITTSGNSSAQNYPDIYYIIFDEFSGFQPMREFWHNPKVDDFVQFLKTRDFFVAEQSHASSFYTLHQMATRLNFKEYPCCALKYYETYYEPITNNEVMRYLKSKGYSTAVFSEINSEFPALPPFAADYIYQYQQNSEINFDLSFDEFGILMANNSMLRAFPKIYNTREPQNAVHRKMIFYTLDKMGDLSDVPSPKFVYIHLMFPHTPFMFDEKGNIIDPKFQADWNHYLEHYNYSIEIAEQMIEKILPTANSKRPPIIILQSDHGARMIKSPDTIVLPNYPSEYKTHIMFALHMPGYNTTSIPQDINPINTFPIVFNYLFNANIPLK